ncbi:MAG: tetratricopeptide repeat protein [Pseudorhodobacter sp.]|nr:tetratricopeptide repeat protein [Pseudorhodobacter sp.]
MLRAATLAFASFALLAACQATGGLSPAAVARNAPPAADARGNGVDGLLVGHRLMEAGEYELALRAYLRSAAEQGMNVDVLSALGSANLHLGRLGQSEQLLRRAVELDPTFVPALNNLGVVLMERGKTGEARVVFQQAFAQDSGETDSIRENLRLAIAQSENSGYREPEAIHNFSLVRRGQGEYVLLSLL